jgi:polysaccharide pyruvyl transferase WcaK-like protein
MTNSPLTRGTEIGPPGKTVSITILGFYGRGNFGDDLMCESLVDFLLKIQGVKVSLVSGNTTLYQRFAGPNFSIVSLSFREVVGSIRHSDIVCQGGGTHFHDSFRGLRAIRNCIGLGKWATLFAIGRVSGSQVVMLGAGVGPLRGFFPRWISRAAMGSCTSIAVRDRGSLETVRTLTSKTPCDVGFDLAMLRPPLPYRPAGRCQERTIAISVCSITEFLGSRQLNDLYWTRLAQALATVHSEHPFRVKIFCLFTGGKSMVSDRQVADLIDSKLPAGAGSEICEYSGDVDQFSRRFLEADVFLCSRYHAAVLAYANNCNFAVITYNRKLEDFADEIRLPRWRRMPTDSPQPVSKWASLIEGLFEGRHEDLLDAGAARERSIQAVCSTLELAGVPGVSEEAMRVGGRL